MSVPQPTLTLSKRLRRAAKGLRGLAQSATVRAYANTCDQAAGRLDEYLRDHGPSRTEIDISVTEDNVKTDD